ncbi:MAG: lipid-A-disaccharide synthase [Gammaproteobacteria bacterium]|nr:lipid-A-disaccharide synthase [Gammaproteobacteria bacterium]
MSYKVMISAGEASGDLHAANLLAELKGLDLELECYGMGGSLLAAEGMELLLDCRELSVVGLVEVLLQYRKIIRHLHSLEKVLEERRPDLLITVDYPGFNLKLAKFARDRGIKVIHYISPQVWAWRAGRVKQIAAAVDHIAVLFPFEEAIYQQASVPVTFVGHPLVDQVKTELTTQQAKQKFQLDNSDKTIGLMPGSRNSEIERLLPVLLESAQSLQQRFGKLNFILPLASSIKLSQLKSQIEQSGLKIQVVQNQTHDAITACDAVITASGTATLEIALLGVPMVIVYKVNALSFAIARRLMKIPYIGLANIVAGQRVVQEFLQQDAKADLIADEIEKLLSDAAYHAQVCQHLSKIKAKMGRGGGSLNMAMLIKTQLLATP